MNHHTMHMQRVLSTDCTTLNCYDISVIFVNVWAECSTSVRRRRDRYVNMIIHVIMITVVHLFSCPLIIIIIIIIAYIMLTFKAR